MVWLATLLSDCMVWLVICSGYSWSAVGQNNRPKTLNGVVIFRQSILVTIVGQVNVEKVKYCGVCEIRLWNCIRGALIFEKSVNAKVCGVATCGVDCAELSVVLIIAILRHRSFLFCVP